LSPAVPGRSTGHHLPRRRNGPASGNLLHRGVRVASECSKGGGCPSAHQTIGWFQVGVYHISQKIYRYLVEKKVIVTYN